MAVYAPFDLLRPLADRTSYTDGGVGFHPTTGWHVKWHRVSSDPDEDEWFVVDRFHVTREAISGGVRAKAIYYRLTRDERIVYLVAGPSGKETDTAYVRQQLGDEADLLRTFDGHAQAFSKAIRPHVGDFATALATARRLYDQAKAAHDQKKAEHKQANLAFDLVPGLNVRLEKLHAAGLGKDLKRLTNRANEGELAERNVKLEELEVTLRATARAEARNVLTLPVPPALVATPPLPSTDSLKLASAAVVSAQAPRAGDGSDPSSGKKPRTDK